MFVGTSALNAIHSIHFLDVCGSYEHAHHAAAQNNAKWLHLRGASRHALLTVAVLLTAAAVGAAGSMAKLPSSCETVNGEQTPRRCDS